MNASGESYSIRRLTTLFVAWKFLLVILACASPGPGYDTSTRILFDQYAPSTSVSKTWLARVLEHLTLRLTRWDGLYFAVNAERGHVNEQDWAFSWTLARFTDVTATVLFSPFSISPIVKRAFAGILISNISHFLAVVTLSKLTHVLFPNSKTAKERIAFTAAALHTVSPAGVFLSAPYGESIFAYLNFAGTLCYTYALQLRKYAASNTTLTASFRAEVFYIVQSGLLFGLAATVRGNGLLNGVLFLWDALELALKPQRLFQNVYNLLRLAATVLAGILVGVGFAGPQLVAYMDFCGGCDYKGSRPWCDKTPPSIYNWVQHHYWGVGVFRYWTLSNLPLFLIAGPVLVLLLWTGYLCFLHPQDVVANAAPAESSMRKQEVDSPEQKQASASILQRLALPQLTLALMAATSFHVQIINRISSGYPLWYIVLAIALHSNISTNAPTPAKAVGVVNGRVEIQNSGSMKAGRVIPLIGYLGDRGMQWIVRGTVMYAIIQGGLYASFLPPA